ncbi:hypothetical protein ACFQ5D_04305 [Paenibacillus farraposensis]|uniref:Uncharacterized protein n=1 Tax=Paenibacillus farraposensis TaxID=2807095 RepID=A0ABW4DBZ0_9BACL|nr:hypothetical protein [Paenibacillus farraposensis]
MSKNNEKPKRIKPKILTKYDQFVVPRLRDIPVWVREEGSMVKARSVLFYFRCMPHFMINHSLR